MGIVNGDADLASIGSLLADRTRATIVTTLLNGGLTASSALAERAGVSRPLASTHLRKLAEGGLVVAEPRGRQRLYRLRSQAVAEALEALLQLTPAAEAEHQVADEHEALRHGRLCYDHLAGRVGVGLVRSLCDGGMLELDRSERFSVTASGSSAFQALGIDVELLATTPRPLTRACIDWSERSHHLAGSLGSALASELLRRDWIRTREASRVVDLTAAGRTELAARFGYAA
jgi:DNA-binding transcriptional ArsR family regulator